MKTILSKPFQVLVGVYSAKEKKMTIQMSSGISLEKIGWLSIQFLKTHCRVSPRMSIKWFNIVTRHVIKTPYVTQRPKQTVSRLVIL